MRTSALYRTKPWGRLDQPDFFNAVVSLATRLSPHELLDALRAIERRLGRAPTGRWGPRAIDLDLLLFDDLSISEAELSLPHERLAERAFVLVPLAELDGRFAAMRDALDSSELAGVTRLGFLRGSPDGGLSRSGAAPRESGSLMSSTDAPSVGDRVRALAAFLSEGDAVRLRIQRGDEEIELTARRPYGGASPLARRPVLRNVAAARRYDQGRPRRNLSFGPPRAGGGRAPRRRSRAGLHRSAWDSDADSQHGAGAAGFGCGRRRLAGRIRPATFLDRPRRNEAEGSRNFS